MHFLPDSITGLRWYDCSKVELGLLYLLDEPDQMGVTACMEHDLPFLPGLTIYRSQISSLVTIMDHP
jgi:hypothetical protein